MRHMIAAALVVSPLMLNAQTATSAQNPHLAAMQSSVTGATMILSSASAPAADRTQAIPLHVSTGVVQPRLISTVAVRQETVPAWALGHTQRSAEVSMVVDEEGKPTDLKIVKSAGRDLDPNILEAVRQYRFRPATVSGQKIAMQLNLYMDIQLGR